MPRLYSELANLRIGAFTPGAAYRIEGRAMLAGAPLPERCVRYCFSDASVGRDMHTIAADAWDTRNFAANPVFLWAHEDNKPPIGRVENLTTENGRLIGHVRYAERDIYPFADDIYKLVKGGYLNATSTGWLPQQWTAAKDRKRVGGMDFQRVELLEISQVPVPALPTALVEARRSGFDTSALFAWSERVLEEVGFTAIARADLEALRRAAKPFAWAKRKPEGTALDKVDEALSAIRPILIEAIDIAVKTLFETLRSDPKIDPKKADQAETIVDAQAEDAKARVSTLSARFSARPRAFNPDEPRDDDGKWTSGGGGGGKTSSKSSPSSGQETLHKIVSKVAIGAALVAASAIAEGLTLGAFTFPDVAVAAAGVSMIASAAVDAAEYSLEALNVHPDVKGDVMKLVHDVAGAFKAAHAAYRVESKKGASHASRPVRRLIEELSNMAMSTDGAPRLRALIKQTIGRSVKQTIRHSDTSSDGFRSFGEFLQQVARASSLGAPADRRLTRASENHAKETDPTAGGFLVPTEYVETLIDSLYDDAVIAPLCSRWETETLETKIPGIDETSRADGSRWGGATAYWMSEADSVSSAKPKFRSIDFAVHKLLAICWASDELINDAPMLGEYMRRAFAAEMSFKLDQTILSGSGAGVPLGILQSAALITVPKRNGQLTSSIVVDNILEMWSRLPSSSRRRAVWLCNEDAENQLAFSNTAESTLPGVAMYMPQGAAGGNEFPLLLGRPLVVVEQAPVIGTTGDIVLADLTQYALVDRGFAMNLSADVGFISDQSVFRFGLRVDGKPLWSSALTPYNGSGLTRSPFVALATR